MASQDGTLVSATFDRSKPDFATELAAFVSRARDASAQLGADSPICVVREEGSLIHIQVIPASSVPGGKVPAKPGQTSGFAETKTSLVELEAAAKGEQPKGSPELAEDVRAMLRKFRG